MKVLLNKPEVVQAFAITDLPEGRAAMRVKDAYNGFGDFFVFKTTNGDWLIWSQDSQRLLHVPVLVGKSYTCPFVLLPEGTEFIFRF